ncbi:MAG TPA: AAC(3) family N-acetyltransferase [Actinoplanes sp.]|nr:AAC(3) family N-acetyltransferase [Actinoplanes sp.]
MGLVLMRTIVADLRTVGVRPGAVVLMHSSFASLGFVPGGPQAAVQAVLEVLGPDGTLVVPTHTPDNSDPSTWSRPPVPPEWWESIRREAPGFDPLRTPPSPSMGVLAATVRSWPGARRSDHPQVSFAAVGRHAAAVTGTHRLEDPLGEDSPLGAVYRRDGQVLLLGVGHGNNTSLHLAETRRPDPPRHTTGAVLRRAGDGGTGQWVTWTEVDPDESDFAQLGEAFDATGATRVGRVGEATARLMSQRALVDFGVRWLAGHR